MSRGLGRWQQIIMCYLAIEEELAAPLLINMILLKVLGREPTASEYSSCFRAAKSLEQRGKCELYRILILKPYRRQTHTGDEIIYERPTPMLAVTRPNRAIQHPGVVETRYEARADEQKICGLWDGYTYRMKKAAKTNV